MCATNVDNALILPPLKQWASPSEITLDTSLVHVLEAYFISSLSKNNKKRIIKNLQIINFVDFIYLINNNFFKLFSTISFHRRYGWYQNLQGRWWTWCRRGSIYRKQYPSQCWYHCSVGLQSWPTWRSIQFPIFYKEKNEYI